MSSEKRRSVQRMNSDLRLTLPPPNVKESDESENLETETGESIAQSMNLNLQLTVPTSDEVSLATFLTNSGTFMDGDLHVNREGVQIVCQTRNEAQNPCQLNPSDTHWSLEDMDTIQQGIGKGNGGVVHLVKHKPTGQFFALKVIQMKIEESQRKQIASELKINQSARSPYVVVWYQSFYYNGAISIILEYMDGGSLADFLKQVKSIPEEYLAAICKQVLRGLLYLHHEMHVIHRDLKPSNLLINHKGQVKIADFGVSRIMASTSGLANSFVGTCNYMSPERIGGEVYDKKSDIWSFGLILMECATGQFPYSPPDESGRWDFFDIMQVVVDGPPPSAPSHKCSPQFCSFISACLKKEPKDRPSAHELMMHPFVNAYEDLDVDLHFYPYSSYQNLEIRL